MKFIEFAHHGSYVWAEESLKGKHTDHCLCFKCCLFRPGKKNNCKMANLLFAFCCAFSMVTPVYECPEFLWNQKEEQ